ncbi:aromatic compound dioxygenase [Aspergillus heteromorphus CBS 117.55]|uniref:Aromatic compound dioxygenase n=1 Tax=Aspergillus heteromorphus CBS 117.55 TaxID=1448321 RepID=A0A317WU84_9EURO|nr:aromatic compound dioxygenase [Aspergillus heteromorphus CBS 117.55]PWY89974.1 aromatic compound dioxygenase [Aspergillus heteromorphus CBS 117.55]
MGVDCVIQRHHGFLVRRSQCSLWYRRSASSGATDERASSRHQPASSLLAFFTHTSFSRNPRFPDPLNTKIHLNSIVTLVIAGYALFAAVHPAHQESSDLLDFKSNMRRGLQNCAAKFERNGLSARAEARRRALVNLHRKRLTARDTMSVLSASHLVTGTDITPNSPSSKIFGSSNTCILSPETLFGPYYVPGEYIRSSLSENQSGVPVVIEAQFVDVETCEPIADWYSDTWSCNATGIYSGLVANHNGNTDDSSNLNNTFLRGVQKTDTDGVVTFHTLFPGHYPTRTIHPHLVAHLDVTVLDNNTISGGTVAYIGEVYWDQDLIDDVEATYPYNTNTFTLATNEKDLLFINQTKKSGFDPVLNCVYLGDSLSDGLSGWVTVVVNVSATYDPRYNAIDTSTGQQPVRWWRYPAQKRPRIISRIFFSSEDSVE